MTKRVPFSAAALLGSLYQGAKCRGPRLTWGHNLWPQFTLALLAMGPSYLALADLSSHQHLPRWAGWCLGAGAKVHPRQQGPNPSSSSSHPSPTFQPA